MQPWNLESLRAWFSSLGLRAATHGASLHVLVGCLMLSAVTSTSCGGDPSSASALPGCDAAEVQTGARKTAAESLNAAFTLSAFSEVRAESSAVRRTCRTRAKHDATGAALWMKFTVERRPAKDPREPAAGRGQKQPEDELAIVFAPIH